MRIAQKEKESSSWIILLDMLAKVARVIDKVNSPLSRFEVCISYKISSKIPQDEIMIEYDKKVG